MEDEEIAFKLVELYVREVSERGERRQMSLDSILNAYMYALKRLRNKEEEINNMKAIEEQPAGGEELEEVKYPPAAEEEEPDMLSE